MNQHEKNSEETTLEMPDIQIKVKKNLLPKDVSQIREMDEKELNETFLNLKKIMSEIGNQACELENTFMFDTCVIMLKMINLYSDNMRKLTK